MPKEIIIEDRVVRFAIRSIVGVAATLVASSVLYIENLNPDIGSAESKVMKFGGKFNKRTIYTNHQSGFSGVVPYMYSGSAGQAGPLAPVFRASGFNQDDQVDKVVYTVGHSDDHDVADADMLEDVSDTKAYQYKIGTLRGVLGIDFTAGDEFKFPISVLGDYETPTEINSINPDYGDQPTNIGDPFIAVNIENNALHLDNQSLCLVSAKSSNIAGFATKREKTTCPNDTKLKNTDAQLELVFKMPDIVTEFNPWELYESGRVVAFAVEGGSAVGKKLGLSILKLQAQKPSENNVDGEKYITQVFDILDAPVFTES